MCRIRKRTKHAVWSISELRHFARRGRGFVSRSGARVIAIIAVAAVAITITACAQSGLQAVSYQADHPVSATGDIRACKGWNPGPEAVAEFFARAVEINSQEYAQHFEHHPCSLHGRTLVSGHEQARWTINRAGTARLTQSSGNTRLLACETCTAMFGVDANALAWPDGLRVTNVSALETNPEGCPDLPTDEALSQTLQRAEPVGYLRYSRMLTASDCSYSGGLLGANAEPAGEWTLESSGRLTVWLNDPRYPEPSYRYCPQCIAGSAWRKQKENDGSK